MLSTDLFSYNATFLLHCLIKGLVFPLGSSYLATKTASRQANLGNVIDAANRVLVLWQVLDTSICRLHRRSSLEDRRQAGGTDIEFAELIVSHLDRVSRVAVALRQDRSSLGCERSVRGRSLYHRTPYSADDLAISRLHIYQSSGKDRCRSMVACLGEDSHG